MQNQSLAQQHILVYSEIKFTLFYCSIELFGILAILDFIKKNFS